MIAGVLVMLAPVCCLLLFRDARALGAASESLLVVNQSYQTYAEKSVNGGPLHADLNGGPLCADAIAPLSAAEQGNNAAGAGAAAEASHLSLIHI